MPTEQTQTLASLIAQVGGDALKGDLASSLMSVNGASSLVGGGNNVYSSPTTNYNYFINGVQLGSNQANRPLSEVLQDLAINTNATVH